MLRDAKNCAKPLPDVLAVNGPMALNAFSETGYPSERLVQVEAARFQYLRIHGARRVRKNVGKGGHKRLLVLGDFSKGQTMKMLHCVGLALPLMDGAKVSITIKFHPVCPIDKKDRPSFAFVTTDVALGDIVQEFDFVFVSNSTSAGLDVLLSGLSVAVFLDGETFNHSPLRGVDGVSFVRIGQDLAHFLQASAGSGGIQNREKFFWLDDDFSKWRRVISGCLDREDSACIK